MSYQNSKIHFILFIFLINSTYFVKFQCFLLFRRKKRFSMTHHGLVAFSMTHHHLGIHFFLFMFSFEISELQFQNSSSDQKAKVICAAKKVPKAPVPRTVPADQFQPSNGKIKSFNLRKKGTFCFAFFSVLTSSCPFCPD